MPKFELLGGSSDYQRLGSLIEHELPYGAVEVRTPTEEELVIDFGAEEEFEPRPGTDQLPKVRAYGWLKRNNQDEDNRNTEDLTEDWERRQCLNLTVGNYTHQVTKVLKIPYKWRRNRYEQFRQSHILVCYSGPND